MPKDKPEKVHIIKSEGKELTSEELQEINKTISEAINSVMEPARRALDDAIKELSKKHAKTAAEVVEAVKKAAGPGFEIYQEIQELRPYIDKELQKPEYNGATLESLLEDLTLNDLANLPPESNLFKVLTIARGVRNGGGLFLPRNLDKLKFGTDKVNLYAWDLVETNGQMRFNLSRSGTNDDSWGIISLKFADEMDAKLSRSLTHFDRRIENVIATGFIKGERLFSLTGIYYGMGNTKKPNSRQLKKIDDSLTKMGFARIYIDTTKEAELYNYEPFIIDTDVISFARKRNAEFNYKETDGIEVYAMPPLTGLAISRSQVTAIPINVLKSPISKTENNLRIEDYLLWRIARSKNPLRKLLDAQEKKYTQDRARKINKAKKEVILFDTFYQQTGCAKKNATAKKRAIDTARSYLEHYKSDEGSKWIVGYKIDEKNEKIIIYLPTE